MVRKAPGRESAARRRAKVGFRAACCVLAAPLLCPDSRFVGSLQACNRLRWLAVLRAAPASFPAR